MMKRSIAPVTVALVLTGCANSPEPEEAKPEPASVEQFASVIAVHEETLTEAGDQFADCLLDTSLHGGDIAARYCVTVAEDAHEAIASIGDNFAELGLPPDEISSLVSRWLNYAIEFDNNDDIDLSACGGEISDDCTTAAVTTLRIVEEVIVPDIAAWKPYID